MPPNVLLVVMDSVRARNVSLYGHENRTTPFLEDLSETATVYDQARSPGIHSVASHVSMFTGYHVAEHRLFEHESRVDPERTVWKSLENDYGYSTGLFTPNAIVSSASNLADSFQTCSTSAIEYGDHSAGTERLFDDAFDPKDVTAKEGVAGNVKRAVHDERPVRSLLNCAYRAYFDAKSAGATSNLKEPGQEYVEEFKEWCDGREGPWAACLNLMDSHYPYLPEPEYDRWGGPELKSIGAEFFERGPITKTLFETGAWWKLRALEALYDGGIYQADQAVKSAVDYLRSIGEFDDTLIVVTSDHGEGFGERSVLEPSVRMVDHSWGIDEVLTHVPLVVKKPGQNQPRRVADVATLTRFPEAVESTVGGSRRGDWFVTNDGTAISSTYRLLGRDAEKFPDRDMSSYTGPWRAVYATDGDVVRKFAQRGEKCATVAIRDAQNSWIVAESAPDDAFDTFDELSEVDIEDSEARSAGVSDETEDRLRDLGYLR